MNIRQLHRDNIFELVVMGAAGLLSILCAVNLIQARSASDEMTHLSARLEALGPAPADDEQDDSASESSAEKAPVDDDVQRISQRNIFSPPKPEGFQGKLIGILGDAAIFQGNQMARVGEQVAGATVTQIGPDWVKLEFEDKPVTLKVFGDSKISGGSANNSGDRSRRRGSPGNIELTPQMIERFKSMPAEARDRALERMPPEMAEKIKQQL